MMGNNQINISRIGILTGGGDAPGLNAVIRAVVKTATIIYGWEVYGIEDGFEGLILPDKVRTLTVADVRGILPRGGTILGTTNRANPFAYQVETNQGIQMFDVSDDVVRRSQVLGLDVLVVIGGDGTLSIAHKLLNKGLPVFGIPKTIDNDLEQTEITFGFDTALNTATEAIDRLHTTGESHHRVMILEVMGRDAGWIALQAGIAGGADVILIPEIPFSINQVIETIKTRRQRGVKFSIVVVAEGAKPSGGQAAYQADRELGGMRRLGGIGQLVADEIRTAYDIETRVTVLGHLQRGGTPSAFDRLLASRFGAMAVHYIEMGLIGQMVAWKQSKVIAVPLEKAVNRQKFVTLDNDMILTARGLGISLGESWENIIK